jgi:hypothetical protein
MRQDIDSSIHPLFFLQKLHCFLFDTCFVVTRICRPSAKFTVCAPVIPAEQLRVEEVELMRRSTGPQTVQSGEKSVNGSFWYLVVQ